MFSLGAARYYLYREPTDMRKSFDGLCGLVAGRLGQQVYVFPRLQEYCQQHGCRFQAIDLRWGVSEKAAADQCTMRICRAEIARRQAVSPGQLKFNPFFVGLCLHEGRERDAQQ
jgi:hypothetical protein